MMSKKRIVALLLTIMMVVQLMPTTVLAEGWRVATSNAIVGEEYYTVKYDLGTGKTITQYVLQGNSPVKPEDPTREGYAFDGWGEPAITQDTDGTEIRTYTAQWKQIDRVLVTIAYQNADGAELATPFQRFYTRDDINTLDASALTVDSPEVSGLYPDHETIAIDLTAAFANGTLNADKYYTYTYIVTYQKANVDYTLVHWVEDEAGAEVYEGVHYRKYSEETKSHVAGATVVPTALAEVPQGYTFIGGPNVKLASDGTNTVNAYYQSNINFLLFDTQGGAYIAAKSAKVGASVELPTAERTGYQFTGWYTDAACTQKVDGTSIAMPTAATTTLYAGWEGQQVNYQVVYWLEKANLDHDPVVGTMSDYAFFSAENRTAVAGTTVTANATDTAKRFTTTEVNGDTTRSNPVATYQGVQNVTVAGDGTTVLNVFYSRIKFTFTFSLGNNYRFYFNDDPTKMYEGSDYKITVKYEQDISDLWPSGANATFQHYTSSGRWPNQTWSWEDTTLRNWGGSYVSHRWTVNAELLPTSSNSTSRTYSANFGSTSEHTVTYWVEGIAGENINNYPSYTDKNTTTNGGKTYWKHYTSQTIYIQDGLSPKDIEGFVSNSSSSSSNTDINFYYSRRSYTLSFDVQGGAVRVTSSTVPFEKKLTSYKPTAYVIDATTKTVNGVPYVFTGWYYEPECKTPVAWDTAQMPAKNLQLYAGWKRVPAVVQVHPNYDGASDQTIAVNVGDKVSELPADSGFVAEPQREGYTFAGWYTDAACTKPYSLNDPLSETITNIYAKWEKAPVSYTVYYLNAAEPHEAVHAPKVVAGNEWGTSVTEYYVAVNDMRPDAISKFCDLVADESQNVITFYYSDAKLSYTIHYGYYDANGEWVDVTKPTIKTDVLADRVVEIAQATIQGADGKTYHPVDAYKSLELVSDSSRNIIRFEVVPYAVVPVTVEHYIQYWNNGAVAEDYKLNATEDGGSAVIGQSVVSESYKKSYEGYTYDHAAQKVVTVDSTTGAVTVKLYYNLRTNLEYTVNYLEQGTNNVLHAAKTEDNQTFGAEVTENAIEIEGYNKVEPTSATITIAVEGNVITFYYTKRTDLSYKVNYLEKGTDVVLSTAKVVDKQTFGASVTEEAIEIEGYNKVEPTSATITIGVENNVINFYYTKRTDLSYTVNYLEQGTNEVLEEAKIVRDQVFGAEVTENAIDIEGYNKVAPTSATITIAVEGNVINFYYTKRTDLSYKVNYLEKDTNKVLYGAKTVPNQTFGAEVTENAIDIEGYNKVAPTSATITIAVEGNVINFYYTKRTDLSYTVNYLEQGTNEVLEEAKIVRDQVFGAEVTENAIDIEGYNKVAPTSATITIAVEGNVINFYYTKRTDLSYTVNYLEQGTNEVLEEAKIVRDQVFGTEVTENAIDIPGYDKVAPTEVTFTIDVSDNEITFYYTKRTDLSYKVNYLEQGTNNVLADAKIVKDQTFGAEVTEYALDIPGYDKVAPTEAKLTIAVSDNEITFYYTKRTDLSYMVNYLEQGTNAVLSPAKTVGGQVFDAEVTENAIDISGYDKVAPTIATIHIDVDAAKNVITFYYTKRTNLEYTVNFYRNDDRTTKVRESATIGDQTFKDTVTEEPWEVTGFTAVPGQKQTITIEVTGNVIDFYYYENVALVANSLDTIYNGDEQSVEGYKGQPEGVVFEGITVGAAGTTVETYDAKFAPEAIGTVDTTKGYIVTETTDGTLTILPRPVTITVNKKTETYDGGEKTVMENGSEYVVSTGENIGLLDDDELELNVVYGDDAAEYEILVGTYVAAVLNGAQGVVIKNKGVDVTSNYKVEVVDGTLIITDATEDGNVVTKTHADGTYKLGDPVTFTISVTNIYNVEKTITIIEHRDGVTFKEPTEATINGKTAVFEKVEPGTSVSIEATYTITEQDILAGSFTNEVEAKYDDKSFEATDKVNTDEASSGLKVTKTVTNTPAQGTTYGLGETIQYAIKVENTGNLTIAGIVVTDSLASATILESKGTDYTTDGKTANIASLLPNTSVVIMAEYTVTEADILAQKVVNSATATGTDSQNNSLTDTGSVTVDTDEADYSLLVTKTATSKPANGETYALDETIDYTITVKNTGNQTQTNIVVKDNLPGATIDGGTIGEDGLAQATIAELQPGKTVTLYAHYTVQEKDIGSTVANSATAGGATDTDEQPTDPVKRELQVTKTATNQPANGETYALGETIDYTITVKNIGNVTQTGIVVKDNLPGATIDGGTIGEDGLAQATIAELKPGKTVTLYAHYTVQEKDIQAGKVANSVTANGSTGTDEKETDKPNNSLKLEKAVTSQPKNGEAYQLYETITYTITVTNDGNQTLENIVVTDVLPDAVIMEGAGYTVENNQAKISKLAAVPEGQEQQSVTVYVQYTVTEEDLLMHFVRNSATATADGNEFDSNVVQVATDKPNNSLKIQKEAANEPKDEKGFALGETIEYTITVTNDGNLTMKDIVVKDELKGAIITEGTINAEGYAEATIPELKPGKSVTLHAQYTVTSDDILAGKVVNAATVKGNGPDGGEPEDKDDDTQETDDINTDLSVVKQSNVPEGSLAKEGQVILYTITVTNKGNVPYTNVQVTDELENLTIDESDRYTVDGHVVTIDTLAVGETVTITASYTVTADDLPAAHVKNVAKAEADPIDDPKNPGEQKTPEDEDEVDVTLGTDVTVKVHWVDGDQFYRPAEGMPVQLIGNNGEVIAEVVVDPRTMGTDWVYTFKDVPINDGNGDPIAYTVREPVAPGNGRYDVEHDGLEVTNTAYVTVTFVGWNGIVLQSERLLLGASTKAPADPIRVGHRFTGWTGGVWENVNRDQIIWAKFQSVYDVIDTPEIPVASGTILNVGDCFD